MQAGPLLRLLLTALGRLLRLLAAIHTIDKKGEYQFTGNETTKALATPEGASAITHGYVLGTVICDTNVYVFN